MGDFSYGHTQGAQLRQRVGVTQFCRKVDGPDQKSGILAWNFLDLSAEDRSLNCWGRKPTLTRGRQSKNEENPKQAEIDAATLHWGGRSELEMRHSPGVCLFFLLIFYLYFL